MPRATGSGFTKDEAKRKAVQKLERQANSRGMVIKGTPAEKKIKPLMGGRLGYEVTVEANFTKSNRR